MKKLKKVLLSVMLILFLSVMLFSFTQSALTEEEYEALVNEEMQNIGADKLENLADDDTREMLEKSGINSVFEYDYLSFSPDGLLRVLQAVSKPAYLAPLTSALSSVVFMLLIKTVSEAGSSEKLKSFTRANELFCLCAVAALILPSLIARINLCFSAMDGLKKIATGFIPVFAAAVAGSGQPISASVAAAGIFTVTELSVWVCSVAVMPLCGVFIAFGIAGAPEGSQLPASAALFIKKLITFIIGGLVTVFSAVLVLKSYIAAAADSFSVRAAKALVSGAVPVIGGGLSESVSAVIASMGVVKSFTGFFGIAVIFFTFLPHIVSLFFWKLCLSLCRAVAKGGCGAVERFTDTLCALVDMLLAVFIFVMLASIVCIAAVIGTAAG